MSFPSTASSVANAILSPSITNCIAGSIRWMFVLSYKDICYIFFKIMISFSFKSVVATWLNISKDTGPVLTLGVVIDDGSNWDMVGMG